MRRRVWLGVFFVVTLLLTSVMVAGVPVSSPLRPLNPVAAAGTKLTGAVGSTIGNQVRARRAAAAEGAPHHINGMTIYHNIQYGYAEGQALLLDAYIPDGGPHAAVVVIHGGGWAHGSKAEVDFEGEHLSADGFAAFVVNYRMAPPGGHWHASTALEDVRTSVVWVRTNAETYGVDPHRVAALGNSAGANLAMMLGTTGTPGVDRVDAVVEYSGQSDLLRLSTSHTIHAATNYLGCSSTDCSADWTANSPIAYADSQTVPMLLVNSTNELMPLDQATGMATKLQELGLPYQLIVLKGDKHANAFAGDIWPQTIAFLRQYLGS
jgi:acetyl esterase